MTKAPGIETTTLGRREGAVYPMPARIGGIRVYRKQEVGVVRWSVLECA